MLGKRRVIAKSSGAKNHKIGFSHSRTSFKPRRMTIGLTERFYVEEEEEEGSQVIYGDNKEEEEVPLVSSQTTHHMGGGRVYSEDLSYLSPN